MTTRSEIEALDAEIQALEKTLEQTSGMAHIGNLGEQIIAKKMEMQRLLALEPLDTPANMKEQLATIDAEIVALETEIRDYTFRFAANGGDAVARTQRLINLKMRRQELLGERGLALNEVAQ